MQEAIDSNTFFTTYQTDKDIILRSGCKDYPNWRAIHSSKSYNCAYQFAQTAAAQRGSQFYDQASRAQTKPLGTELR